jgi:ABC-type nickel/cobalt efflux system permease component RcnA
METPASDGFGFGLLVAAFWFGFRHGIDFDHIAAITDITGSTDDRRRSIFFGTLYALGHALVVLVLGILAVVAGDRLPRSVDDVMTRVVGVTLLILGVYVLVSLVRHGRDFRLRSRWMLVFGAVRSGARWVRDRVSGARGELAPAVPGGSGRSGGLTESGASPRLWHHGHHGRPGHHHHREDAHPEPGAMSYGRSTAFGVGMIHGVGAETPTQVLLFLAAAGAGGALAGISVLVAFLIGLLASNTLITLGSASGFLRAQRNFPVYAAVAVATALFSLVIGTIFVLGRPDLLPALFAG